MISSGWCEQILGVNLLEATTSGTKGFRATLMIIRPHGSTRWFACKCVRPARSHSEDMGADFKQKAFYFLEICYPPPQTRSMVLFVLGETRGKTRSTVTF